jgi:perosamine synthetase
MLRIPFYKPSIGTEEIDEVVATLKSGWLTTGPRTKQFEREFADYLKHKHAIAVNSCTAALHLALEAIGLKAGQGVIVPTMTFAATAEVVRYFGARPILVDCRTEDPIRPGCRPVGRCDYSGPLRWPDRGRGRRAGAGPAP